MLFFALTACTKPMILILKNHLQVNVIHGAQTLVA